MTVIGQNNVPSNRSTIDPVISAKAIEASIIAKRYINPKNM